MTREEAIRELKADYCGNRIICELYPDQCNREDCEIWLAIKALVKQPIRVLETQPDGDCISRRAFRSRIESEYRKWGEEYDAYQVLSDLDDFPSAQPEELSCDGCKFCGQFEYQFPCKVCIRREKDYYARLD